MALASCDGGPTLLVVDLRTDLAPGAEIDGARTEVEHVVDPEADYVEGVRIAELAGLPRGELTLRGGAGPGDDRATRAMVCPP